MYNLFRVGSMTASPKGRSIRIQLEDGGNVHLVHLSPEEVQCCDIRIGDTVTSNPEKQSLSVRLDRRPPEAVPYQA